MVILYESVASMILTNLFVFVCRLCPSKALDEPVNNMRGGGGDVASRRLQIEEAFVPDDEFSDWRVSRTEVNLAFNRVYEDLQKKIISLGIELGTKIQILETNVESSSLNQDDTSLSLITLKEQVNNMQANIHILSDSTQAKAESNTNAIAGIEGIIQDQVLPPLAYHKMRDDIIQKNHDDILQLSTIPTDELEQKVAAIKILNENNLALMENRTISLGILQDAKEKMRGAFAEITTTYGGKELCWEVDKLEERNLHATACNGAVTQLFSYDDTTEEIKTYIDGYCIDEEWETKNMYAYPCHGNTNQKWYFDSATSRLKTRANEECADVSTHDQTLQVYACHDDENQKFNSVLFG